MCSSEIDRRINAIVGFLVTQIETFIQLVRELSQRSSNRSTEGNKASERSRSSGQRSDTEIHIFMRVNTNVEIASASILATPSKLEKTPFEFQMELWTNQLRSRCRYRLYWVCNELAKMKSDTGKIESKIVDESRNYHYQNKYRGKEYDHPRKK